MAATTPSRVVVADDSGFMRRIVASSLADHGFEVVGEARDGDEALELFERLRPDAMTLDLAMPGMDGIGVLRALRRDRADVPVVVVSAFSPAHGARAVDALAEGAFDLVEKPGVGEGLRDFAGRLGEKVGAACAAGRRRPATLAPAPVRPPRRASHAPARPSGHPRFVVIACSTGGPRALGALLPALPSPLGQGGVIVQHMPAGFTASLAQRLDRSSALTIAEAAGGEAPRPDTLLLAPGGSHLRLGADRRTELSDEPPIGALRPRADLTIADAARVYGRDLLLVVLTGMGKDGLEAAPAVRAAGGRIVVEAESTCTVYGMPRAIEEAGLADRVAPLDELPSIIAEEASC